VHNATTLTPVGAWWKGRRTCPLAMASPDRDGDVSSGSAETTCAVCLETVTRDSKASMPCCDRDTASVSLCGPCVRFICERGPGGVGRCPKCRAHVRPTRRATSVPEPLDSSASSGANDDNAFELAVMRGECRLCRQTKDLVDERSVCDACAYGARFTLRHECQRCGHVQRIPHPMWRYQRTPEAFGDVSWACHGRCRDYTRWRVSSDDVASVPPEDAPVTWGTADAWLADVRSARLGMRLRADGDANGDASRDASRDANGDASRDASRDANGDAAPSPGSAAFGNLARRFLEVARRAFGSEGFEPNPTPD